MDILVGEGVRGFVGHCPKQMSTSDNPLPIILIAFTVTVTVSVPTDATHA